MQNATTPATTASRAIGMTTARMIVSLSSEITQEVIVILLKQFSLESPRTSCKILTSLITFQKVQ